MNYIQTNRNLLRIFLYISIILALFYVGGAFATQDTRHIGQIATEVTKSFSGIATLMIAIAYIAGIGFVLAAIFKFKQHKDNPTQIPLGTPLAMLVIGVVLIFLPTIFQPAGTSVFGTGAKEGGIKGGGFQHIPGSQDTGIQQP